MSLLCECDFVQLMALERAGIMGDSKTDEFLKLRDPVGREYIPSVVGKV